MMELNNKQKTKKNWDLGGVWKVQIQPEDHPLTAECSEAPQLKAEGKKIITW